MTEVDLSRLLGGKSFTIPCTLYRNGYGVNTTALADTGANAFTLLDTKCAKKISEFLNTPIEALEGPVPVRGYNGQMGNAITSILRINLRVNRRRQYNVPFLITDLGHHDVILGRKWLAYLDLWLDVRNRQLIWPATLPPTPCFTKEVTVDMGNLLQSTMDPTHQADVARRDRAFEEAIRNQEIRILSRPKVLDVQTREQASNSLVQDDSGYESAGSIETKDSSTSIRKPWTPKGIGKRTLQIDQRENLQKMDQELRGGPSPTNPPAKRMKPKLTKDNLPPLDIYFIGAVGFNRTVKQPGVTPFITSLYEIDRMIEEKEIEEIRRESDEEELTSEELIDRKLPPQYHDSRDVFSKMESDILAPHRPYDLKIELEKDQDLGFSPLRHHTLEELRTMKQYLVDNLHKGFIENS
jgi:predicted aspartyl protease